MTGKDRKMTKKTWKDYVRQAVEKRPNAERAVKIKYAIKLLHKNAEVREPWMNQMEYRAVQAEVDALEAAIRRDAKDKIEAAVVSNPSWRGAEVIDASSPLIAATIFDTWIVRGKPIMACTGTELKAEAVISRKQASGKLKNAEFYEWLSEEAGEDIVGEAVSTEDAAMRWCEIAGVAEGSLV